MYSGGWCADYADQQNWLSVYWRSSATFAQRAGYKNEKFDTLVDAADSELDVAKRNDLYQQAQDVLVDDAPMAFMQNSANPFMVKPWVKGFIATPQDGEFPGELTPTTIDVDTSLLPK